jgi:3',5'-cyclic AMP phosphodiesterase CpdA
VQYGQYPAPRFTVAHLSDVHLLANGVKQYGVLEPQDGLRAALDRLGRLDPVPQALVFTGDLADRGEPEAYACLRELVEPFAARIGAVVVWVMGNHDERAPYARALFDSDDDGPQDRVHDVGGLRIVALDTTVPEYHHGELSDDQLAWLGDVLSTPAEHGTILAMHHPPIPVPTVEPAAIIELLEQERLAEVIRGTDVRQVLGGHFHYSSHSTFAGVPVSVASASCYTTDPAPLDRVISGVDGHQAFNTVHVYDDRVVHTVIPIPEGTEVTGQPAAMREVLDALSPEERREIISSKRSEFNNRHEQHEGHEANPLTEL